MNTKTYELNPEEQHVVDSMRNGFRAFLWGVEDIRNVPGGEELEDDACLDILEALEDNHDANIGINWDIIEYYVDLYNSGNL